MCLHRSIHRFIYSHVYRGLHSTHAYLINRLNLYISYTSRIIHARHPQTNTHTQLCAWTRHSRAWYLATFASLSLSLWVLVYIHQTHSLFLDWTRHSMGCRRHSEINLSPLLPRPACSLLHPSWTSERLRPYGPG